MDNTTNLMGRTDISITREHTGLERYGKYAGSYEYLS